MAQVDPGIVAKYLPAQAAAAKPPGPVKKGRSRHRARALESADAVQGQGDGPDQAREALSEEREQVPANHKRKPSVFVFEWEPAAFGGGVTCLL